MNAEQVGYQAEAEVHKLLKETFPDLNIRWMREEGANSAPFDFEIYRQDSTKAIGLIEVKGFGMGRKTQWTQYKRPAIRRKKRYAEKLGNPTMATIVVGFYEDETELRWSEGFPSKPYKRFCKSFRRLWNRMEQR